MAAHKYAPGCGGMREDLREMKSISRRTLMARSGGAAIAALGVKYDEAFVRHQQDGRESLPRVP